MMGADLTVRQKILVAAVALSPTDGEMFTVEDLVVRAWQLYPDSFGLRGYDGHPDSNRVLAKLSGNDGLCGMGWLEHLEARTYRATRKGRAMAKQLTALHAMVHPTPPPRAASPEPPKVVRPVPTLPVKPAVKPSAARSPAVKPAPTAVAVTSGGPPLSDREVDALQQIVKADALRKFLRGQPLSFTDACAFWGFSGSSRPAVVQQRLTDTAELLRHAVESFGAEGTPDKRLPTLSTVYGLFNLHKLMLDRFSRELDVLRHTPAATG
ncbi:MAG: hypothetical protein HY909_23040 [Deltaproteobacteria bacterium]|nr:hypothetical protein [Deltaproteobacteria bacterium]